MSDSHAGSQRNRINEAIEELRGVARKCPGPELKAKAAIRILRQLDTLRALDEPHLKEVRSQLRLWKDLKRYPVTELVGDRDTNDRNVIVWNNIVSHCCPDLAKYDFSLSGLSHDVLWRRSLFDIADLIATANTEQGGKNGGPEDDPPYLFHNEGAIYRVHYDGEKGTIPTNLAGAKHIFKLLQRPNVTISALELAQTESGLSPDEDRARARLVKTDRVEDADRRERYQDLQKRKAALETERDRAKEAGNVDDVDECEHKIAALDEELGKLKGLGGQLRHTGPEEKARTAVAKAINRLIKNCRVKWGLPRFADHIYGQIERGKNLTYKLPNPAPEWKF